MKFSIDLSDLAQEDIENQSDWYNKEQEGLGNRFYKHVSKAHDSLKKHASKYEVKYYIQKEAIRWTRVSKNFPFLIHYVIRENQVIILGVLNESSEHQEEISKR
jgi:plasmid stabilization system protein ParE